MAVASDFMAEFFGARTALPICIAALANDRAEAGKFPPREIYTRDPKKIDKFVATHDVPGRAIYFCVATVAKGKRRNKANLAELHCLHTDIDFKNVVETPAEIERVVKTLPLPPRWAVLSGHGLHLYWLLQQVFKATAAVAKRIESALKRLAWVLAGDPAVCEVSRLMRVPGSHNSKGGERIPVTVLARNKAEYELEALETWLSDIKRPLLHVRSADPTPPKTNGSGSYFTAYGEQHAISEPIDVEVMLDQMLYPGNVHDTERDIVASLVSRGEPVDNIVSYLVQQLQKRIPESRSWNWAQEMRELRYLCVSWFEKHPELLDKQDSKPDWLRNHSKMKPLLEGISNVVELKTVREEKAKQAEPPPTIFYVTAPQLERELAEPPSWIVPDIILQHGLNGFFGDGGIGKDIFLLQLAHAMTCKKQFLGKDAQQGRVIYFNTEDSIRELRWRQSKIIKNLEIGDGNTSDALRIVPLWGKEMVIATWNSRAGIVEPRPLFASICQMIEEFQPTLVIFGNRVNIFSVEQQVDTQAIQCCNLLSGLIERYNTTVIMPGHPSRTQIESGEGSSGSVQWSNGCRHRLYIYYPPRKKKDDGEPDEGINQRILEVKKSNWGPKGAGMKLDWIDWIFRAEDELVRAEKKPEETDQEARKRKITDRQLAEEREFLRIFDKHIANGEKMSPQLKGAQNSAAVAVANDSEATALRGDPRGAWDVQARLVERGILRPDEIRDATTGYKRRAYLIRAAKTNVVDFPKPKES